MQSFPVFRVFFPAINQRKRIKILVNEEKKDRENRFSQTNLVSGCVKISLFVFKAIKLKQKKKIKIDCKASCNTE